MLTVYSDTHTLHHPSTELNAGLLTTSFESPSRALTVLARVKAVGLGSVVPPTAHGLTPLARVHTPQYLRFLEDFWAEWSADGRTQDAIPSTWPTHDMRRDRLPSSIEARLGVFSMDSAAPLTAGTWAAARASADVALTAQGVLAAGADSAFALCRPPGHHAAADHMGGYCYLNNAAIAAQAFLDQGAGRVAVLDIDYHHGNGTQTIFYDRADVMFVSIHADPAVEYPSYLGYADEQGAGPGQGFNLNLPLARGSGWSQWSAALGSACQRIAAAAPAALVVSLGVDTFKDDPISSFKLDSPDYLAIGRHIATLQLPTLFVLEGGYAIDAMGLNVVNVLQGFEHARAGRECA